MEGWTGGREDGRTGGRGRVDVSVTHVRPYIRPSPRNHDLPLLHREGDHTRRKSRDDLVRSCAEAVDQTWADDGGDDFPGEVGALDPATRVSASDSDGAMARYGQRTGESLDQGRDM